MAKRSLAAAILPIVAILGGLENAVPANAAQDPLVPVRASSPSGETQVPLPDYPPLRSPCVGETRRSLPAPGLPVPGLPRWCPRMPNLPNTPPPERTPPAEVVKNAPGPTR